MKENEPKVKDSQKWWEQKKQTFELGSNYWFLHERHKATYDRLVSLEAKIEELKEFYAEKHNNLQSNVVYMMQGRLSKYESELEQLVKKHLIDENGKRD
jgi:hypothetical protein